ncbi:MAG TPA: adenylate/guanylate cyclase domain-containing protein, partial [Ktedonobacterales bacterium]|nr:adenylate/guanylate cyclase domain-containing protein [Ktedonobacterales bacterium]
MICPHCGAENPRNARFCNNCGRPLPRVCANCGTVNPPGARFCNQCGMPLDSAAAPAATPTPAAPSTVPTAGADGQGSAPAGSVTVTRGPRSGRLGGSAGASGGRTRRPSRSSSGGAAVAEAEPAAADAAGGTGAAPEDHTEQRRVVSVLFADVTGSTAMADAMDAEDVRSLLGAFFARMARAIHRHGGTVEKYIGDAVMAVFGLPIAHEDDPIRAVRAALDMQAALRDYNEQRRAMDAGAVELQMRIGINTGEVVAASGAAEGRDFLITGDPVNVAARLQQTAAPGGILVGPRTYRGTTGAVVYRALAPITVRGKSRPIRVWEAVSLVEQEAAPSPRPRGVQGVRTPLVGRDAELSLLRALYARVVGERRPHLVTIVGAPGVGKTRLAREFIETTRAEDAAGGRSPLFLHGRCPQYGEAITYWPLSEMLRALGGFTAMDAPETARRKLLAAVREALRMAGRDEDADAETLAAYLGYTIGIETPERRQALLPGESQQMQEGLFRAWRVFFEALAARRPLLLLVDDIQWADDILLDLLEYVAAKAGEVSLLMICPARPELLERRPGWGGGRRNYVILGLEALTDGDAERLVRELLPGDDVPERLRRGILRKGEGNPFYFEEIVRMLVDRGILVRDEATGNWRIAPEWEGSEELYDPAIPDTVQGVLAARLDLLSEPERDVLQHAAVIGRYFWPEALIALHPHLRDQLGAALEALRAKDLIHESERSEASVAPTGVQLYTFNHALTREVTYATIPRTRRAHEHQQVAKFLEGLAKGREAEFADVIAQHYRQYYAQANLSRERNGARRLAVRDKVVHYLTLAGEQAAGRHAGAKAARYFTDALALLEEDARAEDVPARVQLYMRRGDAHWSLLRGDEAWADYREALRLWSSFSNYMVEGEARPNGAVAAAVVVGAANGAAN